MIESNGVLSKILEIQNSKEDVRQAIIEKNIPLSETALLSEYSSFVKLIKTSDSDVYKCFSVDESTNTWSAYKGQIIEQECVFSKQLTTGLTIYKIKPTPGYIYNEDASFRIDCINVDGRKNDVFILRTFETEVEDELKGGEAPTIWGKDADTSFDDSVSSFELPCLNVENNFSTYKIPDLFQSKCFTVSFWVKMKGEASENLTGVAFGKENNNGEINGISATITKNGFAGFNDSCTIGESISSDVNYHLSTDYLNQTKVLLLNSRVWNHYAFVYDGRIGVAKIYINGVCCENYDGKSDFDCDFDVEGSQVFYACTNETRIAELVVSNSAFNDKQIKWLAWESDTAKKVYRHEPALIVNEVQHTLHVGESFEGCIGGEPNGVYLNFDCGNQGWNATLQFDEETIPDWLKESLNNVYISRPEMGGSYYGGTPQDFGSWQITGTCTMNVENWFKETFYDNTKQLTSDVKINVDVIQGHVHIEFPDTISEETGEFVGDGLWIEGIGDGTTAYIKIKDNKISAKHTNTEGGVLTPIEPVEITIDNNKIVENIDRYGDILLPDSIGYFYNIRTSGFEWTQGSNYGEMIFYNPKGSLGGVFYRKPYTVDFDYYPKGANVMVLEIPYIRNHEYFAISENKIIWRCGKYQGNYRPYGTDYQSAKIIMTKNNQTLFLMAQLNDKAHHFATLPFKIKPLRIIDKSSSISPKIIQDKENALGDYQIVFHHSYYKMPIEYGFDKNPLSESEVFKNTAFITLEDGTEKEVSSGTFNAKIIIVYEEI